VDLTLHLHKILRRLRIMNLEEEAKQFMHNKNRCLLVASDYQLKAKETAIFPKDKALEYLCLGLVGEAGEIANKAKKVIRDNKKDHDLGGEIGDVLWYCAMLADHLKLDLGAIMQSNLDKLSDRKKRGVLGGSGDRR
jgi:NTP pyrophosphatase (non-canonical NTP hydrolase)